MRPRALRIAENFPCFECPEDYFGNIVYNVLQGDVPETISGALKAVIEFCDFETAGPRTFSAALGARG